MKDERSLPPLLGEPESPEIHEIHQAILKRESPEPQEGLEPTPWWLWTVAVLLLFAMGFYLGHYSGRFTPEAHQLEQGATVVQAAAVEAPIDGRALYDAICLPCHQSGGTGVEGKYPPLAGSEWVAKDPAVVSRIVLGGLQGPIKVKGKNYLNEMPALGGQLDDAEIAAVLTYVRSNFGNKSGAVSGDVVKAVRAAGGGPWTAARLEGK